MCKSRLAFTSLCFFLVFVWGNQKANTTNIQTKINDSEILQRTNKRMNEWKLGHTQLFILFAVVGEKHCDEDVCLSSPFRYFHYVLVVKLLFAKTPHQIVLDHNEFIFIFISFIGVVVIDSYMNLFITSVRYTTSTSSDGESNITILFYLLIVYILLCHNKKKQTTIFDLCAMQWFVLTLTCIYQIWFYSRIYENDSWFFCTKIRSLIIMKQIVSLFVYKNRKKKRLKTKLNSIIDFKGNFLKAHNMCPPKRFVLYV